MSLDKAIRFGKEKRKEKRCASSACWHHGSCSFCRNGRLYQLKKELAKVEEMIKLYKNSPGSG